MNDDGISRKHEKINLELERTQFGIYLHIKNSQQKLCILPKRYIKIWCFEQRPFGRWRQILLYQLGTD
jgi:hypothetical protein